MIAELELSNESDENMRKISNSEKEVESLDCRFSQKQKVVET